MAKTFNPSTPDSVAAASPHDRWLGCSRTCRTVIALVFVGILGLLDYLSGRDISFSIFYLLPIMLATWSVGQRVGMVVSLVSAAVWYAADFLNTDADIHPLIPVWNAVMRLGVFLLVTFLLSRWKAATSVLEQRVAERTAALTAEVAKHREAEEKVRKANRLYALISQINQMVVRSRDQDKTLAEACRIAVEFGQFRMAWIGLVDEKEQVLKPSHWAGYEEGYLKQKYIPVSEVPEGCGPTGTAIRERKSCHCGDIATDPRMVLWREEALRRGYRSSIALPIIVGGKVIGAFNLYAAESFFFTEAEIQLLEEVAGDIAFALEVLGGEEKRRQAEVAREQSLSLLRATLDSTADGILVVDEQGRITGFNERFVQLWRLPKTILDSHADDAALAFVLDQLTDPTAFLARVKVLYASPKEESFDLLEFKDGRVFERYSRPQLLQGRPVGRVWSFRDITERKRAAELLFNSQQMLRAVLDTIPQRVFWKDRNSVYFGGNRAFALDSGLVNPEKLGGKTDADMAWRAEAERYRADDRRVMDYDMARLNYEESVRLPDGRQLCVLTSKLPLHDRDGRVIGVLGTYEDITARKQAEEALRASEAMLKQSQRVARLGHYELDTASGEWTGSQTLDDVFGIDAAFKRDIAGWSKLLHPEDRDAMLAYFNDHVLEGKKTFDKEYRIIRANDGNICWVHGIGQLRFNVSGDVIGMFGVIQDVTGRKQAEEALRMATEGWQTTFNAMHDAVALLSADGTVQQCNRAFAAFLGQEGQALLGHKCHRLVHQTEDHIPGCPIVRARQSGRRETMELKVGAKTFLVVADPVKAPDEEVIGFVHVMRDITERKQAEEEIRHSLAEKEVLLQEVHHRVKNNLQVVSGLIQLQAEGITDPTVQAALKECQSRIKAMGLVHEKLYQTHDLERLDFKTYVQSLTEQLFYAQLPPGRIVRLKLLLAEATLDLGAGVSCGLMLNELVSNALKHAFREDRPGRENEVTIRLDGVDGQWQLTVADNGDGFPAGVNWERSSTLGFRLVRLLAKQLRGTVRHEPSPGTTFVITFPRTQG